MNDTPSGMDRIPWAGPALFCVVLAALVVLFWWFLF